MKVEINGNHHAALVRLQRHALAAAPDGERATVLAHYGPQISRANSALCDAEAMAGTQWHGNCCCTAEDDRHGMGCGHWLAA